MSRDIFLYATQTIFKYPLKDVILSVKRSWHRMCRKQKELTHTVMLRPLHFLENKTPKPNKGHFLVERTCGGTLFSALLGSGLTSSLTGLCPEPRSLKFCEGPRVGPPTLPGLRHCLCSASWSRCGVAGFLWLPAPPGGRETGHLLPA